MFKIGKENNVSAISHMIKSLPDRTCPLGNLEEFIGLELEAGDGAHGGDQSLTELHDGAW